MGMSIFPFYTFFKISFFQVIYHGLCITVFRNIHKKRKEQEKKDRPKPPQKFKFHIPGYVVFLFFFKSNLSWIMHHSVDNHPKKGKRTRKKEIPKPSQKDKFCIAGYVDFSILYIFLNFFFSSNLSWIMHPMVFCVD